MYLLKRKDLEDTKRNEVTKMEEGTGIWDMIMETKTEYGEIWDVGKEQKTSLLEEQ